MIFVTVGAQMPFDRLVRAVDAWASIGSRERVLAQIGRGEYRPKHLEYVAFLDPPAFRETLAKAHAVVAHAGMGTIITALELRKPILVMPRRGDLGETRNDHQLATARRLHALGLVEVALNEAELCSRLDEFVRQPQRRNSNFCVCGQAAPGCAYRSTACRMRPHPGEACPHLLTTLRKFVLGSGLAERAWPANNLSKATWNAAGYDFGNRSGLQ